MFYSEQLCYRTDGKIRTKTDMLSLSKKECKNLPFRWHGGTGGSLTSGGPAFLLSGGRGVALVGGGRAGQVAGRHLQRGHRHSPRV
jgi:hypothetical protein